MNLPDQTDLMDLKNDDSFASFSEQVVLARLMTRADAYDIVSGILTEKDFYRSDHRVIYSAIESLGEQNEARDVYAVGQRLDLQNRLTKVGGIEYLLGLCTDISDIADLEHHARVIRYHSLKRKLIDAAHNIARLANDPQFNNIEVLLDKAESQIFALNDQYQKGQSEIQPLKIVLKKSIETIKKRFDLGAKLSGVESGFPALDKLTDGLQESDIIIVAARPGMGKTSFTMCIANHIAVKNDIPVLFFSLEMPKEQLCNRLLSINSRVNQSSIREGNLSQNEWDRIVLAYEEIEHRPLYIDDTPMLTTNEVRARVRRFKREHPETALIIIDYLQLMSPDSSTIDVNRAIQVSFMTRALKILAREVSLPIVLLSQLSRESTKREGKIPIMSDLRDSGAIEQDADLILFIHRGEGADSDAENKDKVEILVGKNRNGPTNNFKLKFVPNLTLFENYSDITSDDSKFYI